MLPYHWLQAVYVAASGVGVAVLWRLSALLLGRRLLARSLVCGFVWCGATGVLVLAGLVLVGEPVSPFMWVALAFYGGAVWLPLVALAATFRGDPAADRGRLAVRVLAGLLLLVAADATLVEPDRLIERRETVALDAWPADAEPLRIVHVSDLQTVGACKREEEALARIAALEPDFVVVTGDYVAGPFRDSGPAVAAARRFLGGLAPRYDTIVVMGHSERQEHREAIFAGLDLVYLVNAEHRVDLGDGCSVGFHGLHSWPRRERYDTLERPRAAGEVRVVVSHVPDVSSELDGRDVDLHLAGHTHGGQLVVPGFGPPVTLSRLPRRFARGLHRFGDHWLHVTAGIGMEGHHAPRIRLFCPPEVTLLRLVGGGGGDAEPERE